MTTSPRRVSATTNTIRILQERKTRLTLAHGQHNDDQLCRFHCQKPANPHHRPHMSLRFQSINQTTYQGRHSLMAPPNATEFDLTEAKGSPSHRVTGVAIVVVFSSMIVVALGSIIVYYYTGWLDKPLSWIGLGRKTRQKKPSIDMTDFHELKHQKNGRRISRGNLSRCDADISLFAKMVRPASCAL